MPTNLLHVKPAFHLLDKSKVRPFMPEGGCTAQWYFIHLLDHFYDGDEEVSLDLLRRRNQNFPSSPAVALQRARFAFNQAFGRYLPDRLEGTPAGKEAEALRCTESREERIRLLFEAQRVLGYENKLAWVCRSARMIVIHCREIDETAAGHAAYLLARLAPFHPDEEEGPLLPLMLFYDMNLIGKPPPPDWIRQGMANMFGAAPPWA